MQRLERRVELLEAKGGPGDDLILLTVIVEADGTKPDLVQMVDQHGAEWSRHPDEACQQFQNRVFAEVAGRGVVLLSGYSEEDAIHVSA